MHNLRLDCPFQGSPTRTGPRLGRLNLVHETGHHVCCGSETDTSACSTDVRFSNRPVGVKRFQTVHLCGISVTRGRMLLSGIGALGPSTMGFENEVEQSLPRPYRYRSAGPNGHANSPHPSSREGHHSTTGWSSGFLLLRLVLRGSQAAAASLVQQNSVPSTQMRCMITASRRASATMALFMPRRLAICIAQALSHDHRVECTSMTWAAS